MADANGVDAIVLGILQNDAQLQALCPDGTFWDLAPAGLSKFVLVSLFDHEDATGIDDCDVWERTDYLVKAVVRATGGTIARDASARIHTLLHRTVLDLAPAGYAYMAIRRVRRVKYNDPDPTDKAINWQHRGGTYELVATPL
jgi:hypothetical protein